MMETLDRATWIQTPTERRQDETQMTERGWEVCWLLEDKNYYKPQDLVDFV